MIGEQINNLCKVLSIADNDTIHMVNDLRVINPEHTMMVLVENLDGTPVFGVADELVTIDTKRILKTKIGAKEELTPAFEGGKYILSNEDVEYQFVLEEAANELPIVPNLGALNYIEVEKKVLETFITQSSDINDHIKLITENGELHGCCESSDVKLNRKLAKCDSAIQTVSAYSLDYMKKWVKVAGSTVTLGLETDHPMTAEWSDKYYKYKVLLAPWVEN